MTYATSAVDQVDHRRGRASVLVSVPGVPWWAAVLIAFVPTGDVNIKPIALGLAVGVFVDAFIVRMVLVPAVLALLGKHAWWMPRWLDRLLPDVDVEGARLERSHPVQDGPQHADREHAEAATPAPDSDTMGR